MKKTMNIHRRDSSKESLADRYSADFDISYRAKKFISGGSNLKKINKIRLELFSEFN